MAWDLKLLVGPDLVAINAFSQVMSVASPVFAKMLQSDHFAEGRRLAEHGFLELKLPEDDAATMQVLVHIFHHRTDEVSTSVMTLELLAKIATLVDRYDCVKTVHPWTSKWRSECLESYSSLNDMPLEQVMQLFHISCQLGYTDLFHDCISAMVDFVSEEDITDGFKKPEYELVPQSLHAILEHSRSIRLDALRKSCLEKAQFLETHGICYDSNATCKHVCASLQCGSFLRTLGKSFNYKDWRDPEKWTRSVRCHIAQLKAVGEKIEDLRENYFCHHAGRGAWARHETCCDFRSYLSDFEYTARVAESISLRKLFADFADAYYKKTSSNQSSQVVA